MKDEKISKLTGADLFKVEPVNAYPYNYQECCDVAKAEVTNNITYSILTNCLVWTLS